MESEGEIGENLNNDQKQLQIDSASALQQYLDHISVSSIPGIRNSLVVELKAGDTVKDAVHMLYEKDIFGAPIADDLGHNTSDIKSLNRYIGFIDFANMVLWCLVEYENIVEDDYGNIEINGFFSILDNIPQIGQTKVGELAKSFIWEPFFPVRLDDTFFHALLLLAKHRLHVLPVIDQSSPQLIGFITQNAVVQFLLQSTGLEWFDNIADKALSDFRFDNQEYTIHVFGDQTLSDSLHVLWKNRSGAVAIVDRESKKLVGIVRKSDVYHLVQNDDILKSRKSLTVGEFIHTDTDRIGSDPVIEPDIGAFLTANSLCTSNSFIPRMDSPITNKKRDKLKQLMKHMAETNSGFSILLNDNEQVTGLLTVTDLIEQFAPPCVNSSIDGGGFFNFALEQSGCHVENRTMVCNHPS